MNTSAAKHFIFSRECYISGEVVHLIPSFYALQPVIRQQKTYCTWSTVGPHLRELRGILLFWRQCKITFDSADWPSVEFGRVCESSGCPPAAHPAYGYVQVRWLSWHVLNTSEHSIANNYANVRCKASGDVWRMHRPSDTCLAISPCHRFKSITQTEVLALHLSASSIGIILLSLGSLHPVDLLQRRHRSLQSTFVIVVYPFSLISCLLALWLQYTQLFTLGPFHGARVKSACEII